MLRLIAIALIFCAFVHNDLFAAEKSRGKTKATDATMSLPTLMVEEKSILLVEDFSKGMPGNPAWNLSKKGEYAVVDGVLSGFERPTDHHAGVLAINVTELPAASVVRFRFRVGESGSIGIMAQGKDASGTPNAPFRIAIDNKGFRIGVNGKSWEYTEVTKQTFDKDTWYQMTIEYGVDEVIAWTDEQHKVYKKHELMKGYRMGISLRVYGVNCIHYFDDVMISTGTIKPEWDDVRSKITAKTK